MSAYNDILAAFNTGATNADDAVPVTPQTASNPIDAIVCRLCGDGGDEGTLLLCDGCEVAMHTSCLNMRMIPPGDWFCQRCNREGRIVKSRAPMKGDYVYLYERVSSPGQNAPQYGRVGMDTQNHELMKYCFERNMVIRGTFMDVGSGRDVDRLRDFAKMVRQMPQGTCVMIYSVSRFGRNLAQVQGYLNALHRKDCYVYSVTEGVSSFDQQFLNLVTQAQQESVQLSATMKASVARRRQEGHWIGPAPYGFETYRDDQNRRRVRHLATEASGLQIFTSDQLCYNQVYDALVHQNIQPRTGTWTLNRVINTRKRIREAILNTQQ